MLWVSLVEMVHQSIGHKTVEEKLNVEKKKQDPCRIFYWKPEVQTVHYEDDDQKNEWYLLTFLEENGEGIAVEIADFGIVAVDVPLLLYRPNHPHFAFVQTQEAL